METIARAFLISPMGNEGDTLRAEADWVADRLVGAACDLLAGEGCVIDVRRSDAITEFGGVLDQIVERIVEDRIVFAVLHGDRPNCYFEVALAIAAGRPVIILKHDREKRVFDTSGYRQIRYSLNLGGEAPAGKVAELAEHIRFVLRQPKHLPAVHHRYDPLGAQFSDWSIVGQFRDISLADYSAFLRDARRLIVLQGMTLGHFADRAYTRYMTPVGAEVSFFDLLRTKMLGDACDVVAVMMDERNETLPHLHRKVDPGMLAGDVEETRGKIRTSFGAWTAFEREMSREPAQRPDGLKGGLKVVRIRHGVVHYRLSMTDAGMILSPYFNRLGGGFSGHTPAIRALAGTSLYKAVEDEVRSMVEQNATIVPSDRAAASG